LAFKSYLSKDIGMFEENSPSRDQHTFGGPWTLLKLSALEKYLAAFTRALSRQHFTLLYIDGLAGTGQCEVTMNGTKTTVDGSAKRALLSQPPFDHYCFIEHKVKNYSALTDLRACYPQKSIQIVQEDANIALAILLGKYNWRKTRAVLFLDPYGFQVNWSTLQEIAKTEAIDVWYLFPYAGLYRQAAKKSAALDQDKIDAITRILGTEKWRNEFYSPSRQAQLFGEACEEREMDHEEILKYVSKRLRTIFPAVTEPKILYQGRDSTHRPRGAPLFALYFAASNPNSKASGLATKIAKEILDRL
jgi:three-Cys-motif partner protein